MTKTEKDRRAKFKRWRKDWCTFADEQLMVALDQEQKEILRAVQTSKRVSVVSGTARGKDFVAAVAALCFLYLTPKWNTKTGELIENTKVALTGPTNRQIENIMVPEFTRLFNRAKYLPGRLVSSDIRTDNKEWFMTGFAADPTKAEVWAGFHAVNTMFIVTEASGMSEVVYEAIEGNLQGNSRILLVFNPNTSVGYAARSQKAAGWSKFRLNSLTAPNVIAKKNIIPGQVDYEWVLEKLQLWCNEIEERDFLVEQNDFRFEGKIYRPNDQFRKKVLGVFPKVDESALIPQEWVELAFERHKKQTFTITTGARLGVDVAGMGRDSTVLVPRYDNYVLKFQAIQSGGKANHMEIAGMVAHALSIGKGYPRRLRTKAFIDTIGEGAGIYSRLEELGYELAFSCKYSERAQDDFGNDLTDITGQYKFANMRAYLFWAVRDWLNPANKTGAAIPYDEQFLEEATEIKWKFQGDKVIIEPKEDIVERLKRSPDKFDALANTFYPEPDLVPQDLSNMGA